MFSRRFSVALVALALVGTLAAAGGCKYHPQDPTPGTPGTPESPATITTADVAARIRRVADSLARIYPDKPGIAAVALAISSAAALVESGDLQAAGHAIIAVASQWPAYREYALMASIALELLSPGPVSGAKSAGMASWTDCVKKAAPREE